MQKIMFNDKYGLTKAVLEGRKTMTRREIKPISENVDKLIFGPLKDGRNELKDGRVLYYVNGTIYMPKYKVGEVVAVAQCYEEAGVSFIHCPDPQWGCTRDMPGYNNKMFVRADLMPHRIRVTNVRVEKLQDISDEDVYKEGFEHVTVNNGWGNAAFHWEAMLVYDDSLGRTKEIRSPYPREAFAALIDKVSGNGTWESNPWVFVYEFELVK